MGFDSAGQSTISGGAPPRQAGAGHLPAWRRASSLVSWRMASGASVAEMHQCSQGPSSQARGRREGAGLCLVAFGNRCRMHAIARDSTAQARAGAGSECKPEVRKGPSPASERVGPSPRRHPCFIFRPIPSGHHLPCAGRERAAHPRPARGRRTSANGGGNWRKPQAGSCLCKRRLPSGNDPSRPSSAMPPSLVPLSHHDPI